MLVTLLNLFVDLGAMQKKVKWTVHVKVFSCIPKQFHNTMAFWCSGCLLVIDMGICSQYWRSGEFSRSKLNDDDFWFTANTSVSGKESMGKILHFCASSGWKKWQLYYIILQSKEWNYMQGMISLPLPEEWKHRGRWQALLLGNWWNM